MKEHVIPFNYNREQIKEGILHIGVGNFHRAHEEYYTNLLLEDKTQQDWGICGAMLRSSGEELYNALKGQDFKYTLTIFGRDGEDETYLIGSLLEVIRGADDPQAVINKIADKNIRIISLTITEGGYNIDKKTGDFILKDKDVQYDLKNPESLKTVFGFVAEGLRQRRKANSGGITILSCDNLQHNGDTTKRAFTSFFKEQDPELAAWVEKNVTFPNSMVDRIAPSIDDEDIKCLNEKNGVKDKAPVYSEDFTHWVIEDNFIAGRPKWEEVGVEFTNDVTEYENMKLSLLNASHVLLSYPSFLSGYRTVDEAMHDKRIEHLVSDFMNIDITPYVPAPKNINLDEYKKTLIERFKNRSVSDQLSRLCFDGISKFPVYIMPNLEKMIKDKADLTRVAFLIADYRQYLRAKADDKGEKYEISEPWLTKKDETLINSDDPIDFLSLSPFQSANLKAADSFVQPYLKMVKSIQDKGTMKTLEGILS